MTKPGPILAALLRSGVVRMVPVSQHEGATVEYVGTASDGTDVNLGNVGEEKALESYLRDNPTPDKW